MASPTISKAVAGIQTVIVHFQTVAAAAVARARFRLPQKSKIERIGASFRDSDATVCQIDVKADGVSLLSAPLDMIPAAPAAPVATAGVVNGAINLGTHSYRVTFVDAEGESVRSAKSNVITLAAPTAPVAAEVPEAGDIELGTHSYKVTFLNASGESVASVKSNVVTLAAPAACTAALAGLGAGNVDNGTHSYKVTFIGPGAIESVASAKSNVVTTVGGDGQVALTVIPVGPAGTTGRNIYRSEAGDAGPWKLVAASPVIPDNATATYADNVADVGLGAAAPVATGSKINLSAVPVGPAGTLSRNVYRSAAGDAGPWLLAGNIPDNATVVFSDTGADGTLGAAAPVATGSRASVVIPVGPAGTTDRKVYRTDAGDGGNHKLVGTVAGNVVTSFADNVADGGGAAAPTIDTRTIGEFQEAVLVATVPDNVAKEAEITVDVPTLTGTNVLDLALQIDLVRID